MDLLDILVMRNTSGTAWEPDASPMIGVMAETEHLGGMAHGNVFAGVDAQGSDRGETELISTNWLMGMGWARTDRAMIIGRAMFSGEPLTVQGDGYPLLLQTGETFQGKLLHDSQHPHDFFMELAMLGRLLVRPDLGLELYVAPAGEPALGPGGFPHRMSAINDPLAPLGHHWQDATHITYGVVTLGAFARTWKIEGSWFNGNEPDEDRWDLDLQSLDSGSARLTVNPHRRWSAQGSYGWMASPEALDPGTVERITASVTYTRRFGPDGYHATTAVWGSNIEHGDRPDPSVTDALLVESTFDPLGGLVLYGRGEYNVKTAHDLVLEGVDEDRVFGFPTVAAGAAWGWEPTPTWAVLVGMRANLSVIPDDLEPFYGTRTPAGVMLYVQTRPTVMPEHHDGAPAAPGHDHGAP